MKELKMTEKMEKAVVKMTLIAAIREVESNIGVGHEMTCAYACNLLGFKSDSEEAGMLLSVYNELQKKAMFASSVALEA